MPAIKLVTEQGRPTLSELMGGDEARVLRVLRAFCNAANNDLLQLDGAVRDGNGALVRQLARRLAVACHLVGEGGTGGDLDVIAATGTSSAIDPVMTQHLARVRIALADSIARIALRAESAQAAVTDNRASED